MCVFSFFCILLLLFDFYLHIFPQRAKSSILTILTSHCKATLQNGYGKEVVSLLLDLAFNKLDAIDFQYGYFQDNHKSKKLAEKFGFAYDRTIEFIRPWDQELKLIDECLLDRETYLTSL